MPEERLSLSVSSHLMHAQAHRDSPTHNRNGEETAATAAAAAAAARKEQGLDRAPCSINKTRGNSCFCAPMLNCRSARPFNLTTAPMRYGGGGEGEVKEADDKETIRRKKRRWRKGGEEVEEDEEEKEEVEDDNKDDSGICFSCAATADNEDGSDDDDGECLCIEVLASRLSFLFRLKYQ
ncbi:hypothetical protein PoB_007039400 [Plakobranchus ocellatus]|uniref:Uncharacterized protein n=1 Tax=Plakobranchus ocellatus TaxID=259542 RepID=A0AAV4DIN8_9GAST|nr:hypothetical protein PoB_007039400 [Plakobranchus ocellatus]